jgi:hypothetical protein
MEGTGEQYVALLRSAAKRLTGAEHRAFIVEVTEVLCDGNPRQAEQRFGWGRATIAKGQQERRSGVPATENLPRGAGHAGRTSTRSGPPTFARSSSRTRGPTRN